MKTLRLAMLALAAALLAVPPSAQATSSRRPARGSANILLQEGLAALETKDFDTAIRTFEALTKVRGESADFFLLGYAHYQRGFQSGNPDTADKNDAQETVTAYSMALTLDPELQTVAQPYRLYHSMALSYETLKSYDKALDAYRLAFQASPESPMMPLYAARLRCRMGDGAKCASNLELSLRKARSIQKDAVLLKTIKSDPLFAVLLASEASRRILQEAAGGAPALAQASATTSEELRDALNDGRSAPAPATAHDPALTQAIGAAEEQYKFRRYRPAIDAYAEVIRLDRQSPSLSAVELAVAYERMGTAYNKLGQSAEAVTALQRSLQQMPANAAADYQLALAYSVSGRFSEALRALSRAIESAPSAGEKRRYMLLAKTDIELEPIRDLPAFQGLVSQVEGSLARR